MTCTIRFTQDIAYCDSYYESNLLALLSFDILDIAVAGAIAHMHRNICYDQSATNYYRCLNDRY